MSLPRFRKKLREYTDERSQDLQNAQAAQRKTKIDEISKRVQSQIPMAGVPPAAPGGGSTAALMRSVVVSWPAPPAADGVETVEIELTPAGHPAEVFVRRVEELAAILTPSVLNTSSPFLAPVAVLVRMRYVDLEGLASGWTILPGTTPGVSTVDQLSANRITAGSISAAVSITSGGHIAAGGARMDPAGIKLTEVAAAPGPPTSNSGDKITPLASAFAAVGFYNQMGTSKGVHSRSDGAGATMGEVLLEGRRSSSSIENYENAVLRVRGDTAAGISVHSSGDVTIHGVRDNRLLSLESVRFDAV